MLIKARKCNFMSPRSGRIHTGTQNSSLGNAMKTTGVKSNAADSNAVIPAALLLFLAAGASHARSNNNKANASVHCGGIMASARAWLGRSHLLNRRYREGCAVIYVGATHLTTFNVCCKYHSVGHLNKCTFG